MTLASCTCLAPFTAGMEHHEWVSVRAPPHSEFWFCFGVKLKWGAHTTGTCYGQDKNLGSPSYEPSSLLISYLALPHTLMNNVILNPLTGFTNRIVHHSCYISVSTRHEYQKAREMKPTRELTSFVYSGQAMSLYEYLFIVWTVVSRQRRRKLGVSLDGILPNSDSGEISIIWLLYQPNRSI